MLDVAHNPDSISALLETIEAEFPDKRRVVVFSSSKDKDYEVMVRLLPQAFSAAVFTEFQENPRAVDHAELMTLASGLEVAAGDQFETSAEKLPAAALQQARTIAGPAGVVCVTGSFFLAAEASTILDNADDGLFAKD